MKNSRLKALILLGGLGTRLRPFTLEKPKPLLPILNRPFLSFQLAQLKKHGVREVILALGYGAAHFRHHLGSGAAWGVRFIYSLEKTPLGTGGAIRKALPWITGPTFMLNGDALSDIDLSDLLGYHRSRKADGTLTLASVANPTAFGLIETENDGKIRRFLEKPSPDQITVDTINAGYYLFEPVIVQQIPPDRPVSIEREVFPRLLESGLALYGYHHKGYWKDIGTLRSYWETHMDLLERFSASDGWKVKAVKPGLWAGRGCRIGRDVKVQGRVLLGDGCRIGDGVVFEGKVSVGPSCRIEDNARLCDSVLHEGTRVGAHSVIENSLVGKKCRIEDFCRCGPNEVLANGSVLKSYSQQIAGLSHHVQP